MMRRLELRQEGALPVEQIERFAELPGSERIVQAGVERKAQFAEAPEARTPLFEECLFALIGIKGHEQVHRPVEHGQDAGVVRGVLVAEHDQVFHGRAQVAVIEVMHGERSKRPDAERRLGDDAELAVAEQHAVEPPGVLGLGAFQDLAGGRHDPDRQGLVRAAAQARGVDVNAADAERAADRSGHVERRREVIELMPAERLRERVPVDPGFAAHGHIVLVDREHRGSCRACPAAARRTKRSRPRS